jgi:diaminopimelate epimerase
LISQSLLVYKLVATGNDFIFVDARKALPSAFASVERAVFARKICDRHFGVGADGLVFVEDKGGLSWDFYNSDGSHAEMCGNATRCMGRWANLIVGVPGVEFMTAAGLVRTKIEANLIASELPFVKADIKQFSFGGDKKREAFFVNTGVPHAVVDIDSISRAADDREALSALRFHPITGLRGANVTFLETISKTEFRTVTFERGVEGFTLSCGTGVLAAAAVGLSRAGGAMDAQLETPGGKLTVHYGLGFKGVTLTGPAELIFSIEMTERILK